MTATVDRRIAHVAGPHSPWLIVLQAGAALAAGMGVGRFVYTPILPLMHAQAGMTAQAGADLATANYVGYLLGALFGIVAPAAVRSSAVLRGALIALIATLAAMPITHSVAVWMTLRLLAGVASALVFVAAASCLLVSLRDHPAHLPGWAFGGVGAGIVASGLLLLVLRSLADWRVAWWASAGLAAAFTAASWNLRVESPSGDEVEGAAAGAEAERREQPRTHRCFSTLLVAYSLEGVGYIIAGTFLVAAIEQNSPGWIGSAAWVLVGLAAVPSAALWTRLGRRFSRPGLLVAALAVQAVGIVLPALIGGVAAALLSAVLFGATFLGVSILALATGAHLRFPRSVALLTAGYSVGQILGPLVVTPLLHHGYRQALLFGAAVVCAAALAAVLLRIGFPHHLGDMDSPDS